MSIVLWEKKATVAVLSMNNKENRMNLDYASAMIQALDEILEDKGVFSVVICSSDEKNWSQGIDLQWLMERKAADDLNAIRSFLYRMNDLFKKLLLYPMPVIAAINGHAFGNGALLSCTCDFRFMRSDKGFFCFPEVDVSIPFLPGMIAFARKAIPEYKYQEMVYSGRRFTASELEEHHVIRKACRDQDELMKESMDLARTFEKKRGIFGELKKRMYKSVIQALDKEDREFIEPLSIVVQD
ncbi:MAG: enoyl-CoA hydratase/isomerase family protein [Deltaproteobacteria bacterium]|jgi:enoyl-CoA hydratase/carnithine racemase|nr:enoyl-CoA hydratase/isomerase family protein [Deltaproteobacteria bacterium]